MALLRGGTGVLGTRFHSGRKLVRALSGCVSGLPARQEQLLTLRYGVGGKAPLPAGRVADRLDLVRRQYTQVRRRAFRGLVRAARAGGCEAGGGATGASGSPAAPAQAGARSSAGDPAGASQQAAVGVLREKASGGSNERRTTTASSASWRACRRCSTTAARSTRCSPRSSWRCARPARGGHAQAAARGSAPARRTHLRAGARRARRAVLQVSSTGASSRRRPRGLRDPREDCASAAGWASGRWLTPVSQLSQSSHKVVR